MHQFGLSRPAAVDNVAARAGALGDGLDGEAVIALLNNLLPGGVEQRGLENVAAATFGVRFGESSVGIITLLSINRSFTCRV